LVPASIASDGGELPGQYLISYLINDVVAVDAGPLGIYGPPRDQARVKHVLLSHGHVDHTATLPIFVENAYEAKAESVVVHASEAVLDGLRRDTFNGRVWPDFVAMSEGSSSPFLRLSPLEPLRPVTLEGLTITPVPMEHVVPTFGFVITDASTSTSIGIASDTGPTEEFWRVVNAAPGLAAVFLEASFPNAMAELARASKHLTPETFAVEVRKLQRPARVLAVHLKARFRREIVAELEALGLPDFAVATPGRAYEF
jgi:ribonuclease BN (tRNA processing enzyme)